MDFQAVLNGFGKSSYDDDMYVSDTVRGRSRRAIAKFLAVPSQALCTGV